VAEWFVIATLRLFTIEAILGCGELCVAAFHREGWMKGSDLSLRLLAQC